MRDKHLNSDYVEYLRQASKCLEQHNNAYSNLCSEIELPNSRMETSILRTQEPEDDNSVLLLM
jgi:hypothetical protein